MKVVLSVKFGTSIISDVTVKGLKTRVDKKIWKFVPVIAIVRSQSLKEINLKSLEITVFIFSRKEKDNSSNNISGQYYQDWPANIILLTDNRLANIKHSKQHLHLCEQTRMIQGHEYCHRQ